MLKRCERLQNCLNKMARLDCIYAQIWLVLFYLTVAISTDPSSNPVQYDSASSSPLTPPSQPTPTASGPSQLPEKGSTTHPYDQPVETSTVGLSDTSFETSKIKPTTIEETSEKKLIKLEAASPIGQRGEFSLTNEEGEICLKALFEIIFKIYYKSKTADENQVSIPLSAKANADGQCGSDKEDAILILQWDEDRYTLKFTFKKNPKERRWVCERIQLTYDKQNNPDFAGAVNPGICVVHTDEGDTFFGTKLGMSRSCKTEDDKTLISDDKKNKVVMEITRLHLQPFDIVNGTFGEESPCPSDLKKKNNTASLVVGLLLAMFILIVISGYAVGRKMGYITERPGYSTME